MKTPTILVINPMADRHIATITNAVPGAVIRSVGTEEAPANISDADILVTWGWYDLEPLLTCAPKLQWVHSLSAGVESLLSPAVVNGNIILTNSKGIHSIPVSEHVLALMLAFSRDLPQMFRNQANKEWKRPVVLDELHEKTVGIVGLGSIGREIAKKCKALGMRVLGVKQVLSTELFIDHLYASSQLDEVLPQCDYIISATPLVEKTKELFDEARFSMMKDGAVFINIARGGVVVEQALINALTSGKLRGAGLDVFVTEPLPAEHPFWAMENVIVSPHIAGISPLYLDRAIKLFADNLSRYLDGRDMLNVVDKKRGY